MKALGGGILHLMRWLIVGCMVVMVVLVFGNVVLRYGFNSGISISEEMSRYVFVWLIFLGAVVAMVGHMHLGADTVVSRLPRRGKQICAVLADLAMLGCCALLFIGGWKQTWLNMGNAAPVSGVPLGVMHAAALVASVGLGLVIAAHLWRVLSGRASEADLMQVVEAQDLPASHTEQEPRP